MKFPLIGQTYTQPYSEYNGQRRVNYYLVNDPTRGASSTGAALFITPGLINIGAASDVCRGLIKINNIVYGVFGNSFSKIVNNYPTTNTFTETSLGHLLTSSGNISIDANDTQIIIDDQSYTYVYTVSTNTFTRVTDPDILQNVAMCVIDQYAIFAQSNSETMYHSGLGDATTYDALNFTKAANRPGNIKALANNNGTLWVFKEETIEPYYDAASASGFAFAPIVNTTVNVGCGAVKSVVKWNNTLAWLDHRRFIVYADGWAPTIIGTQAIHEELARASNVSDAVFYVYQDMGCEFLVCRFPSLNKTFCFDSISGVWHERSSFINGHDQSHLSNFHIQQNGYHIVSSWQNPNLYIMDSKTYLDDTAMIRRINTCMPALNEDELIGCTKFEMLVAAGNTTVTTGQGSAPQIELKFSKDGGHTFSLRKYRDIGSIGAFNTRVRVNQLGTARRWVHSSLVTDPIPFCMIDAFMELDGVFKTNLYSVEGQNA